MDKEAPKFGKTYDTSPRRDLTFYEEDHSFIPGQEGLAKISIARLIRPDGLITSITVSRRNSFVPSNDTVYFYTKKDDGTAVLKATKSHLFDDDSNSFLVEAIETQGSSESFSVEHFPNDPQVKRLLDLFEQPKPGQSPDLTSALEEARKINHPSIRFINDGDGEALLITTLNTDLTPGSGVGYLVASVIRFTKGERTQISSIVLRSLIGSSDESLEPLPIRKEFFYTDGRLTGRKQYVGDELIYTDQYVSKILTVDGKDVEVFDWTRDYSEWGQRESGRKGEYRENYVDETGKIKRGFRGKF